LVKTLLIPIPVLGAALILCILVGCCPRLRGMPRRLPHRRAVVAPTYEATQPQPRRTSRCKPEWVVREVLRLKVLMGKRGCRKIADSFNDQHSARTGCTVGKTFVAHCLKANQYALSCLRHEMRNRRPRLVPIHLCLAIGRHGKPQRTPVCAPWCNGRMERLFGTLKPLLRQLVIPKRAALQAALEDFTLFYNHARPHQNLEGLTPAQVWNGWSKTDLMQTPPKRTVLVQALDGLLVGYCTRR